MRAVRPHLKNELPIMLTIQPEPGFFQTKLRNIYSYEFQIPNEFLLLYFQKNAPDFKFFKYKVID